MPQPQDFQNSRTDLLSTRLIDFNQRQIKNAADAVDNQDYVTLKQLNDAKSSIPTTNITSININGKIQNGQPGAVLYIGSQGELAQDSTKFNYAGVGKLNLVTLNSSSLAASKPVKSDSSKNLVSGLIILTSDVSGILPVANGGTGTATAGITGAITFSPTTASVATTQATIQYKDWAGTNQSATFLLTATGTFIDSASITTNAFTNGFRTT